MPHARGICGRTRAPPLLNPPHVLDAAAVLPKPGVNRQQRAAHVMSNGLLININCTGRAQYCILESE